MKNYVIVKKKIAKNLCFLVNGKRKQLLTEQIIYMEAVGNYTVIHLKNEKITTSFPLMFFEEALFDKLFMRIHDKHLVNTFWVENIWLKTESKVVLLKNGTSLTISRRRSKEISSIWKLVNQ